MMSGWKHELLLDDSDEIDGEIIEHSKWALAVYFLLKSFKKKLSLSACAQACHVHTRATTHLAHSNDSETHLRSIVSLLYVEAKELLLPVIDVLFKNSAFASAMASVLAGFERSYIHIFEQRIDRSLNMTSLRAVMECWPECALL